MRWRNFVLIPLNVYDFYLRLIDQPGKPNANADEAFDGSYHPPEQRWGAFGHADCLYSADGAVA